MSWQEWNRKADGEILACLAGAALDHHIRRSGQVPCPTPHHPRWDGESCGACGAQV